MGKLLRGLRRTRGRPPVPDLDDLPPFVDSASYWESRYRLGQTSGAGSYDDVAAFKARVLNGFVAEHGVRTVVELGCGDGNQLSLASYPHYTGYDVAPAAVEKCRARFRKDRTKQFRLYDPATFPRDEQADLALSLEVIFHLVEDDVFEQHMRDLFAVATRFVGICSSNHEAPDVGRHVRNRRFTDWIDAHRSDWQLVLHVENPHRGPGVVPDLWFYAAPEPSEQEPAVADRAAG